MRPILIEVFGWRLTTYGTTLALGYLIGILWLKTQIKWMGLTEDRFWSLIYTLFIGAVLGGKLLFLAVEHEKYFSGRISFFGDFRYGFVFFGGLLGAVVMGFVAKRRLGFDYLAMADFFGIALPMGHWLGRFGCLGAGCCYGRPTNLPWGVRLGGTFASATPEHLWGVPLHPVQIYESLALVAIFMFLLKYVLPRVKDKRFMPGTVFLGYVTLYSIARFFIEFFRFDDRGSTMAPFSISQWISLAVIATAGALMYRRGIRTNAVSHN